MYVQLCIHKYSSSGPASRDLHWVQRSWGPRGTPQGRGGWSWASPWWHTLCTWAAPGTPWLRSGGPHPAPPAHQDTTLADTPATPQDHIHKPTAFIEGRSVADKRCLPCTGAPASAGRKPQGWGPGTWSGRWPCWQWSRGPQTEAPWQTPWWPGRRRNTTISYQPQLQGYFTQRSIGVTNYLEESNQQITSAK